MFTLMTLRGSAELTATFDEFFGSFARLPVVPLRSNFAQTPPTVNLATA